MTRLRKGRFLILMCVAEFCCTEVEDKKISSGNHAIMGSCKLRNISHRSIH